MSSRPLLLRRYVTAPRCLSRTGLLGICLSLSTMLLACGGDKQATITDTDGATTAGETQATAPTDGQTSDTSGSETGEPTTGDSETTDGPTTEDTQGSDTEDPTKGTDTEDPTKGTDTEDPTKGSDSDTDGESLEKSCQHACDAFSACDPEVDLEQCIANCLDAFKDETKECVDAALEANMCFAMLSCDEMDPDEPPFPCEEEEMLVEAVCDGGEGCGLGVGMGMGLNECEISYDCEFDSYEMLCMGDTCTCSINKEKVGECASENYCAQIGEDDVLDLMIACCGFDL